MLVKVIKQIKTTTEEIFYIEASSEDEAAQIVSSNKNLDGYLEETKQEELVYGIQADFTGYAKIVAKHDKESLIFYSPTLKSKDIKKAMVQQIEWVFDVRMDGMTAYVDNENGTCSWTLEVLDKPTITEQELKIKGLGQFLAAQLAKDRKNKANEEEDPAIYDEKYFQFLDNLKRHG
ncbi:hypothetical protein [Burkholderia cenocepacia]|uniref:hypothetical protein n=1 Tax=Burkholderia cenocepacia TaxID=95486 RepID=UPI0011773E70|nr:hypothetical protein [Burkholderia cenocepacia]